ncbi:MAG: bifunctional methylenetetrahydrofolate dehydrogenase/methenyltetrahydrofolate cyclohydrolase [Bacillota bacterium]|nr:bifunctional methylenetetrahydrofolate dehydrogenase/methenyltetrahydrofolate cyclohydrolase [Bacillota bacterium]
MGEIIDVKQIAEKYREEIKKFIIERKENNKSTPKAANIIAGEDGGSIYYLNNIINLYNNLGIEYINYKFGNNVKEQDLLEIINSLNNEESIQGIMMFMPLPPSVNSKIVSNSICYKKDIDGLTPDNMGRLYSSEKCFIPNTPRAIITILKDSNIKIEGKRAVVIGRSSIVGRPVSELLLKENATVTICHSKTENIRQISREADILISAVGRPGFIDSSFIKEGAVVIDVGTSSVNGRITGDVNLKSALEIASYVTKVPGGVGSLTTTMLAKNLCEALMENDKNS